MKVVVSSGRGVDLYWCRGPASVFDGSPFWAERAVRPVDL
jgi:hypothetical protein